MLELELQTHGSRSGSLHILHMSASRFCCRYVLCMSELGPDMSACIQNYNGHHPKSRAL